LPDFGLTGQLAFLQLDAKGNKDSEGNDLTHFTALFGVDVYNKKVEDDERLAFSELGSIGIEAGIAGEAIADLHFELKLNSDLAPGIAGVFPKVVTDFLFDWSIDGDETTDELELKPFSELKGESALNLVKGGLNIVEFQDVALDLGSFISDFIEPVLGTVREVTEPLQPIIDFLTTPLPVISDIGPDMTVLDIAAATGRVKASWASSRSPNVPTAIRSLTSRTTTFGCSTADASGRRSSAVRSRAGGCVISLTGRVKNDCERAAS